MSEPALTFPIDQTPAAPPAPAGAPTVERAARTSFLGHAKLIGALTLVSRVLGLVREVVAGHYLGTGLVASAFTVAFVVPNLFRKLFGEGALSAAFIPLYAQSLKRDGEPEANRFAAAGFNMLCALLLALTVLGELALWLILALGADSLRPATLLTIKLTMIMLPYVLLICGTAFLGGVLQVHRRFGPPAAAPVILNLCHIAVVFVGARMLMLHLEKDPARALPLQTTLAYWLAAFVLVAGVLQVIVLLPALRASGFRFHLSPEHWKWGTILSPAVRRMLKLTVPVALGAGVLQLSVLLDKGISVLLMQGVDGAGNPVTHFSLFGHWVRYPLELGAPARLNLAQFLYQFPLGVFAIALATAIFPSLSAEAADADPEKFKAVVRRGIEATLFEGLPATLGLILVREPAVRLLFEHGHITAADAEWISRSVLFYSMAIWAFSLQQIINRAYYALHDTTTPLVMSIVTLGVNLVAELPLLWTRLGESGMAVGTAASFTLQAVLMLYMLDRRVRGLGLGKLVKPVGTMLAATAVMAGVCWQLQRSPLYPRGDTRTIWTAQLLILMATGAGVYFLCCALGGMNVLNHLRPKRANKSAT